MVSPATVSVNTDKTLLTHTDLNNDLRAEIHTYLAPEDMGSYTLALGRFGQNLKLFSEHPNCIGLSVRIIQRQIGQRKTFGPLYHRVIGSAIAGTTLYGKSANSQSYVEIPQHETKEEVSFQSLIEAFNSQNAGYTEKKEIYESMILKGNLSTEEKRELIGLILDLGPFFPASLEDVFKALDQIGGFTAATPAQLDGLLTRAVAQSLSQVSPSNGPFATLLKHIIEKERVGEIDPHHYVGFVELLAKNTNGLAPFRDLMNTIPLHLLRANLSLEGLRKIIGNLSSNPKALPGDFERLSIFLANAPIRNEISEMPDRELKKLTTEIISSKNFELFKAFSNALVAVDAFSSVRQTLTFSIDNAELFNYSEEFVQLLKDAVKQDGAFN